MRNRKTSFAVLVLAAAAIVSGCAHDRLADSPARCSGRDLYALYCSSCHGMSGDGVGSVAPFIAAPPPSLTGIAARNGGTFPADRVFRTIDGQVDTLPLGRRHMPIWGYELFDGEGDDETAHQRVLDMEHR
ncbi:MAG TPA: cytochrome c, partial [Steroidobacteraceae bacterium]